MTGLIKVFYSIRAIFARSGMLTVTFFFSGGGGCGCGGVGGGELGK